MMWSYLLAVLEKILPFLFKDKGDVNSRHEDREDFNSIEGSLREYADMLEARIEKLEEKVDKLMTDLLQCQLTHIQDQAKILTLEHKVASLEQKASVQ